MIDQPTIDKILEAANILEVVSQFVTLRKRGTSYVGLCPFHADKSPSFYVSPAKNICKCFACGEGGTAVHFIMKHEQLTYFDALRWLAKKYHIEIQERELTPRERQMRNDRESMLILNTWAQKYFTSTLLETEEGRSIGMRYFAERGLREDIVRKFQLGYSLDQRDALFKAALRAGYKREYLERTGLVIPLDREPGQMLDRFRGRVIYPVHTLSGKVVAFGGRILKKGEKTAKYVNSPESEVYHKSSELYGLYFAKQEIVKQDRCYLVEGYMDVIGMHQVGVENVVASSGTALTQGQIRLIHRFTNNITVLYDGDSAGIKAALRGIDMLLEEGMNVKVVLLPDGEDPDSFARKQGASEFAAFMAANETDFIRFKTNLLLEEAGNDPIRRTALIADIVRSISVIPDGIARSVYVRECSSTMEIAEQVLLDEIAKLRQAKREQDALVRSRKREQEIPPTMPGQPIYPDYDPLQPLDLQQGEPVPPTNFPPPPPEEEAMPAGETEPLPPGIPLPEEAATPAPVEGPTRLLDQVIRTPRSPLEPFELTLMRYVVRYGERVLYDYQDEESGEHIQLRVAEFIQQDLAQDDLHFYTPLLKQMLEEAVAHCKQAGFEASRYFLSHPEPTVSKLAADLISEKYQLSKYHTRYRELDREEDMLETLIPRELYAFKEAYIMQQIKTVQQEIKAHQEANDMEAVFESMKKLTRLNEIKGVLSKELGERIILKM
ncbi:MAG: DNA primase [Parabacteroides sp.]|nr:DNA primase [Parabacteroides sp.]